MLSFRRVCQGLLAAGCLFALAAPLHAQSLRAGRIVGVVSDPAGVPQMGATVTIAAEPLSITAPIQLLTDARGRFATSHLTPGIYSVRATLAGFLPALQSHIRVTRSKPTSVQMELGSVFAGFSGMRRGPGQQADEGEWGWVLRAAAATRPILRWQEDGGLSPVESTSRQHPRVRSRIDLTSGPRPGAANSFADSPATSIAYDQSIGAVGRLLLAGQFSFESDAPSGGFATLWMPEGDLRGGPVSSLVIRQSRLGPTGPELLGVRLGQDGTLALSDDVTLRFGAEYFFAGLGNATTSGVRPRAQVAVKLSPDWQAAMLVSSRPWPESSPQATAPLQSALESLDAFPTMLFHEGRPVLENGWHEEMAVEHRFHNGSRMTFAGFHDHSDDTAVFGQGGFSTNPNFLQDFFSNGFAYDAGSSGSWGTRAAFQEKISKDLSATAVYAWAGALTPILTDDPSIELRDALSTRYHHSVAGSVSTRIPYLKTQITSGYKWIDGTVVSRQDEYGEAYYHLDPYLNLVVRQPIPCGFAHRHMDAVADFGNLLAQGYVPISTKDGRMVMIAAYRTFRGGISLQF